MRTRSDQAFCVPIVALTWYFDVIDDLLTRIVITTSVFVPPVLALMSQPRALLSRWELFGSGLVVWLMLLILVGDRFELPVLKFNAFTLLVVVPYCWIVWLLMGRRLILFCALLLGLAVMMVYWVKAMANADVGDGFPVLAGDLGSHFRSWNVGPQSNLVGGVPYHSRCLVERRSCTAVASLLVGMGEVETRR